jgi:hypothetical protein
MHLPATTIQACPRIADSVSTVSFIGGLPQPEKIKIEI